MKTYFSIFLGLLLCSNLVRAQLLEDVFENCLITDLNDNIKREQPIIITEVDLINKAIKTNFSKLNTLSMDGDQYHRWYISQGEEAQSLFLIDRIDLESGWIYLGEVVKPGFELEVGEPLEFFNPLLNYEIINDRPLFEPYPDYIDDVRIKYIQSGGLIERAVNDYVLLTPVVFGHYKSRSIYYATSTDLEHWEFQYTKIVAASDISFAKKGGHVFSSNNPLKLDNGDYLVLLGVEQPNGLYTSAYMVLNDRLSIVKQPSEIKIAKWHGMEQNSYPLSIVHYDERYRLLLHRRNDNRLETEVHEFILDDLSQIIEPSEKSIPSKIIHKASDESGYLRGKADDISYLTMNAQLYLLIGSEEHPSDNLTSLNRVYGLAKLVGEEWIHDKRSPLLLNPIGIHEKFPELEWTSDHLGGFISPIVKNDQLYLFLSFGTDNPDYFISGIKIDLKK
jgi:hypothetical protein